MVTWPFLYPLPPHAPPCLLGQMNKLREEKEHRTSQVQELEASLAELRSQIGKRGLEWSGSRPDVRGLLRGALNAPGRWVDGRALWLREKGLYEGLASLG